MNENVIFVINYIFYNVGSLACPVFESTVLKSKYGVVKNILIYAAMFFVPTMIKFNLPVYGDGQNAISLLINVMYVIYLKACYDEKLGKCIFVHAMFVTVSVLSSLVWSFMPNPLSTNYEIDTTIGYLCATPLVFSLYFILTRVINIMQKKNIRMAYSVAVLAFAFSTYSVFASYMSVAVGLYIYKSPAYIIPLGIMLIFMLVTMSIAFALAYIKSNELELKSHLTRLETARSLEEESYRRTLERIEAMAKLRHDFYGQLQAARYLLEASPEEGRKMLEDMRKQVGAYE